MESIDYDVDNILIWIIVLDKSFIHIYLDLNVE